MRADCSSEHLRAWPECSQLPSNGVIMIEGYMNSQKIIDDLSSKHNAYLITGYEKIKLNVIHAFKSNFHLSQAFLKPSKELVAGQTYILVLDGLSDYEKQRFAEKNYRWKVVAADNVAPVWNKTPVYQRNWMQLYGCGPALGAAFCVCVSDEWPILYHVKVRDRKNDSLQEYYVLSDADHLSVGHDMCSGEFDFDGGSQYEISFAPVDVSLNEGSVSETFKISGPSLGDQGTIEYSCDCDKITGAKKSSMLMFMLPVLVIMFCSLVIIVIRKKKRRKSI
jgi:hypothetical protein